MGSSVRTLTVVGLIAGFSICSPTRADLITPVEQNRQVSAFVIVPPCGGKDGAGDEAEGFGPFEGTAAVELVCKDGLGVAAADQVSRIESAVLRRSPSRVASSPIALPMSPRSATSNSPAIQFARF